MSCKFCGILEGATGRSGKVTHINRDGLCGPCATLLNKLSYQPDKLSMDEWNWFNDRCEKNRKLGMFIPVAFRGSTKIAWSCRKCGKKNNQDFYYTNYCTECADEKRHNRCMPPKSKRKQRSDKGLSHNR